MKTKFIFLLAGLALLASSIIAQTKPDKKTSPKVAKEASKILRDPKSTPAEKSVAGSALSQSRGKKSKN